MIMKNKYAKIVVIMSLAGLLITSCYKSFDPGSYAPAFTINGFTSSRDIKKANLVGYWAFEGSYIDSVSSKVATGVGTTFVNGFKGKAMQGAMSGYVISDITSAISNLHSFTISYWINTPLNTAGIVGTVNIARTDDFWGNLDMFYENGGTASSTVFKTHVNNNGNGAWIVDNITNPWNTWMNVTITYDQGTSTFVTYINGSVLSTNVNAGFGSVIFQNATKLIFGTVQFQTSPSLGTAGGSQGWASYLTGIMDEIRIYNAPLTAAEVNSLVVLQGKGK